MDILPEEILGVVVRAAPEKEWFNIYRVNKSFVKVLNPIIANKVKLLTTRQAFIDACRNGNYLAVRSFAKGPESCTNKWRLRIWQNDGLCAAASQHHTLLTLMLCDLPNINPVYGIIGAIKSGDAEWVKIMMSDESWVSESSVLAAAVDSGNVDILKLFEFSESAYWLLKRAVRNGKVDMIQYLQSKMRGISLEDKRELVLRAYQSGKDDVIKMIRSGIDQINLSTHALRGMCAGGHIEQVRQLAPRLDSHSRACGLEEALYCGKIECVIYLLELGTPITVESLGDACATDNVAILDLVIDKLDYPSFTWDSCLKWAVGQGNINIVKRLTTFRQYQPDLLNAALSIAAKRGRVEIFEYLLSQGTNCYYQAFVAAIYSRAYDIAERILHLEPTVLNLLLNAQPYYTDTEQGEFVRDHISLAS